jgi:cardiolipin synthase
MTAGPRGWIEEEVFVSSDAYLDRLSTALDGARHAIDLEVYIFQLDALGEKFADRLSAAAARGVVVRVVVDGIGSFGSIARLSERFCAAGVGFKVYHPVRFAPLMSWLIGLAGGDRSRRWMRTLNRRNHRKVCIIDMREAWVGSINISAVHCSRSSGAEVWRDTGVRVRGEGVRILRRSFERVWRRRLQWRSPGDRSTTVASPAAIGLVRLNVKQRHRRRNARDLVQRVGAARQRVWITNAYFVPHGSLLRALAAAAKRGVDVRVLVPERADVFFMPWVAAYFYERLLRGGVRLFEYTRSMLHAKSIVIDDWGLIGSSNLNQRSLQHDLEVDLVVQQPGSLALLGESFEDDLRHAVELRSVEWGRFSLVRRVGGAIAFALRRWL